ncbi:MAG: hypothetical protein K8R02_01910 [Anaerohalosphaeraceae bacterium]|nr:hypothetical protein [Anaerohalosphaeraceae bacterium]
MKTYIAIMAVSAAAMVMAGCSGYSDEHLYSKSVKSVYVEMFDNATFRRDLEYDLSNSLAKQIEAETPYKIVSDRSKADTVISGEITSIVNSSITVDIWSGRNLENQAEITASFSWKNLKTGDYLIENKAVTAAATYSEVQKQSFSYAANIAANRLAMAIVEKMQTEW